MPDMEHGEQLWSKKPQSKQWRQGKREYWLLSMVRIRLWLSQRHVFVLLPLRVWQGIALWCKHHPSLDVTNGARQLMKDQRVLQFLLGKFKGTGEKRKRTSMGLVAMTTLGQWDAEGGRIAGLSCTVLLELSNPEVSPESANVKDLPLRPWKPGEGGQPWSRAGDKDS